MDINDVIKQYPHDVPVSVAAKLMGKSDMYVRTGLQCGRLPFGSAVKSTTKWSYHISPQALRAYLLGERVVTSPEIIERVVKMTVEALKTGGAA